jgi:hypothetical protein
MLIAAETATAANAGSPSQRLSAAAKDAYVCALVRANGRLEIYAVDVDTLELTLIFWYGGRMCCGVGSHVVIAFKLFVTFYLFFIFRIFVMFCVVSLVSLAHFSISSLLTPLSFLLMVTSIHHFFTPTSPTHPFPLLHTRAGSPTWPPALAPSPTVSAHRLI